MYRIVNKRGQFMATDRVPVQWTDDKSKALGWTLYDDAKLIQMRLFRHTHKFRNQLKIIWEE